MLSIDYAQLRNLYINGSWQPPNSGTYEPVINPTTEEPIGEAPVGDSTDIDAAIIAARAAFDHGPWPQMSMNGRIAALKRFRDCLKKREKEVSQLLQAEVGVTQLLLNGPQYQGALEVIDYCLQLAAELKPHANDVIVNPSLIDPTSSGTLGGALTVFEPYGVVAAISAYNYPLLLNISKLAPALLTGNCLVLKPSPLTPFSALLLGAIADEAELPEGVLNIITGGADVGDTLTSDPRIDLISFTGSDNIGAAILQQSAKNLKKVHLELGGKSAMIVRHDADVKAIKLQEHWDCSEADQGPLQYIGFGQLPEQAEKIAVSKTMAINFMRGIVHSAEKVLGVKYDRIVTSHDFVATKTDIERPFLIKAGTVGRITHRMAGHVDAIGSAALFTIEYHWLIGDSMLPEGVEPGQYYVGTIEGRPSLRMTLNYSVSNHSNQRLFQLGNMEVEPSYIATILPCIQAIPSVCRATAGLMPSLDPSINWKQDFRDL